MKKRSTPRDALDRYYTPPELAKTLLQLLGLRSGMRVLEPHVGGGAFSRRAQEWYGAHVTGVDLDPHAPGLELCNVRIVHDFLTWRGDLPPRFHWVIGNPPYRDAVPHIERALSLRPACGVAFILRLAILESKKRATWWLDHMPTEVFPLADRPCFRNGGSEQRTAYGWFVWRTTVGRPLCTHLMAPVLWRPPRQHPQPAVLETVPHPEAPCLP